MCASFLLSATDTYLWWLQTMSLKYDIMVCEWNKHHLAGICAHGRQDSSIVMLAAWEFA